MIETRDGYMSKQTCVYSILRKRFIVCEVVQVLSEKQGKRIC